MQSESNGEADNLIGVIVPHRDDLAKSVVGGDGARALEHSKREVKVFLDEVRNAVANMIDHFALGFSAERDVNIVKLELSEEVEASTSRRRGGPLSENSDWGLEGRDRVVVSEVLGVSSTLVSMEECHGSGPDLSAVLREIDRRSG